MGLTSLFLEQMTGIEPAYSAWEADTLPLSYICKMPVYYNTKSELCQVENANFFLFFIAELDNFLFLFFVAS